jgi:hypothetical protein
MVGSKCSLFAALLLLVASCNSGGEHMSQAEDPQGRFREQIAVGRRVLGQKEDWASRAEWEVQETSEGWKLVAWRIEHPEAKGAARYLPWGYSVIKLDRRLVAVDYQRKGRSDRRGSLQGSRSGRLIGLRRIPLPAISSQSAATLFKSSSNQTQNTTGL